MKDDKLQEIIELLPYSIRYSGEIEELLDYAREQAERVNELETTVDFYQSALRDADRRVQELEEENVILKATRAGNEEHIDVLYKQNKYLKNEIQKLRKQLKQK